MYVRNYAEKSFKKSGFLHVVLFLRAASKDNVTVAVISIVTQKWFVITQDGLLLLIKRGHIYRKEQQIIRMNYGCYKYFIFKNIF